MNNDLIERYVYAVTRRMSRKSREDVARELRGLIDDMLTERCGALPPSEKDVRVVLTELGSPQELYEKYDENSKKCLIGQPYYSTYLFVLKIVLCCAAFGLTVANGIQQIIEPKAWYVALGTWLGMLWQGLLGSFAFVTGLFAVFYQKGIRINEPFNFDELPPVPKKNEEISRADAICGIVFSMVFLLVFLCFPQIFSARISATGEAIPIFDGTALRESWFILILFTLCGIGRETVKLMERRYGRRVLLATLVSDGVSAALVIWWLSSVTLINPEFLNRAAEIFAGDASFLIRVFTGFQYFFQAVVLLSLALDAGITAYRSLRT